MLHTLVERIGRAQDLGGVRAGALARVEARLRLLEPLLPLLAQSLLLCGACPCASRQQGGRPLRLPLWRRSSLN